MSGIRTMSLGQRSRSLSVHKVCAFQNLVQPIPSSCMVEIKKLFDRNDHHDKTMYSVQEHVKCQGHCRHLKVVHSKFMSDP